MKFALMGHGIVGSGTVQLFFKNRKLIESAAGESFELKYILDIKDFDGFEYDNLFIKDFSLIENDPEVSVVVETIGGVSFAYDFCKRCLAAGKSVVTSNKELVATRGTELIRLAIDNGVVFKFEASVGGCIPVIKPLSQCLSANNILSVTGILNGTTNFILNKMEQDGTDFDDALALAQKLGYAELNPAADVDGHDCARKISILGGIAFGEHISPDNIPTTGIRSVTARDLACARKFGGRIKLISRAAATDAGIVSFVRPMYVGDSCLLSNINDVFNGILVDGDATGEVMFYGRGAGKTPTASAVISDIIDCVKERADFRHITWNDADGCSVSEKTKFFAILDCRDVNPSDFEKCIVFEGCTAVITRPCLEAELVSALPCNIISLFPVLE